ncbi:nucleotide-binding protein [Halococcus agarilyticus]|uniref:nucleotide-binding protein n=1 Tax=Halococcus agarilyticus TaxID=1232219 RepID=UPI000677B5DC|nr:nucleotide-binding protein [Halococcus agarilyticus]
MKTVIDTSALIALLYPDDDHNRRAAAALHEASTDGATVINDVVYTELAADPYFGDAAALDGFLDDTGIGVERPSCEASFTAGTAFETYLDRRGEKLQCPACGEHTTVTCPACGTRLAPRQHVAADFVIGAHATEQADRLLTFDEGLFSSYFDVELLSVN